MSTPIDRSHALRLKTATRDLQASVGSCEASAAFTGKSKSVHASYQNPKEHTFMPLDVIARLEQVTGDPIVTTALAALADKMLVDITAVDISDVANWAEEFGGYTKEVSEALAHVGQAYASGGVITADETRQMDLIREIDEGIGKMFKMRAILSALTAGSNT